MNFKQIQLNGFKSFADQTSISFEDGITGIVGPNGCGKSNVADAVRWVIGEQSAKNMRGSSMQDVIFGGTEKRKATSMCEVTLLFDNSKKLFDIDYTDVAITRRLYRSGESEYLINNRKHRLRDIVNLLHGVGIGKEGYSIIGQGKVDQIMNSKPHERRAIFEEATGVVVFKSRKAETERRLSESKDDLNTYLMRMDEVKRNVESLEKQAESARKYNALFDELKKLEINLYISRCDSAEQSKHALREKMDGVDVKISQINAKIEGIDASIATAREQIGRSDEELSSLNDRLLAYTVSIEKKSGEARVLRERINTATQRLEESETEIEESRSRIEAIATEIAESEQLRTKNQKRLASIVSECEALEARIAELSKITADYEQQEASHRKSVLTSVESLSDLKHSLGSLTAQQQAVADRIAQIREELEKIDAKVGIQRYKYDECIRRKAELSYLLDDEQAELEKFRQDREQCDASSEALSQQIYNLNAQIGSLRQSLQMYQGLKERFEGYRNSVRKLLLTAKTNASVAKSIQGVIADIISCDRKYEVAIETAFGASMQDIVTANQDDARYLIEFLKRTGGGIATFRPVSSARPHHDSDAARRALREEGALGLAGQLVRFDPYYSNVVSSLIGNTLVCDNIANATAISKKYPAQFRIVTLDGDVIAVGGSMTGGSKRADAGNLLSNERKIKETEQRIAMLTERLSQLTEERKQVLSHKTEMNHGADKIRDKFTNARTELAGILQRQSLLEQHIAESENSQVALNNEMSQLNDRLAQLASEYTSSYQGEELIQKQRSETEDELLKTEKQYHEHKAELDKKQKRLNSLQIERVSVENAIDAATAEIERVKLESETLADSVMQAEETARKLREDIRILTKSAEETTFTDEEKQTVATLRNEIESVSETKKKLNDSIIAFEDTKNNLLTAISEENKQKYGYELQIAKIDSDLQSLQERIAEAYGVDYEGCLAYKTESFNPTSATTAINRNKRQIAALGTVNLNAIADYDTELARYEDMLKQKTDLEKGIADLTEVLEDLRQKMQKKFDEGFNQINANFVQVFKELFGGGKAHLELDYTDCDDLLDAGVEIFACPPGKKLTKISLLSGGERALTAIAILFAILKLRPMPLCILDEIEAALDDSNAVRFAKYLKNYSKNTQFIVITHRKQTMEQANILYGVTMEEKGVSKIVSVKLADVSQKLGKDAIEA